MKTWTRNFPKMMALSVFLAVAGAAHAQYSDLRITEAMSSSGTGGTVDWFELTNYGLTAVSITGWTVDDSSFTFLSSLALNGVSSVAPGESVLFLESAAGADIAAFRTFWGGIEEIQIGYYSGSGIGLSSSGDGLVVFNSGGTEETPRVTFGAATAGSSFYYAYDADGNPVTSPNTDAILSTVGVVTGQTTYTSANVLGNIASPGSAVNAVPEPSTGALLGLGLIALVRRLKRKAPAA